jgi:N-acetyl-gamma-glutamyl-phosphate reductase
MNNDKDFVSVSIIGASGYVGGELLRLLLTHPKVELKSVVSETYAGKSLSAAFPGMVFGDLKFSSFNKDYIIENSDLVFFAQDHGAAIRSIPEFLAKGCRVIDLSADFRLKKPEQFLQWYKQEHTAVSALKQAVYGLPELFSEEIKEARLVANPGCYPTATALALIPLLKNDIISHEGIVIDAKSGVSGAGRAKHSLDFHFPELNQNFKAYAVGGTHRHTPEIEQTLSHVCGREVVLSFTPHLLPISRGILASCYCSLKSDLSHQDLYNVFSDFYKQQPFVRILEEGQLPSTKACYGTNLCLIGFAIDARTKRVSVFSAIDNLTKGASGQALQNLNIMFGFDQTLGLSGASLWP